jgi:hypothetical protein
MRKSHVSPLAEPILPTVFVRNSPRLFLFLRTQLVERACSYFCLQDWSAGIKDLTFVLVFVPTHIKALLMR